MGDPPIPVPARGQARSITRAKETIVRRMNRVIHTSRLLLGMVGSIGAVAVLLVASPVQAQWPQFGGPNRDFTSTSTGLSTVWPEDGPKKVWSRPLGDGYSGLSVDDFEIMLD